MHRKYFVFPPNNALCINLTMTQFKVFTHVNFSSKFFKVTVSKSKCEFFVKINLNYVRYKCTVLDRNKKNTNNNITLSSTPPHFISSGYTSQFSFIVDLRRHSPSGATPPQHARWIVIKSVSGDKYILVSVDERVRVK